MVFFTIKKYALYLSFRLKERRLLSDHRRPIVHLLYDITIFYGSISHAVDKSYSPNTITTCYVDMVSSKKRRLFNVATACDNCHDRDVIHSANAYSYYFIRDRGETTINWRDSNETLEEE